MPSATAAPGAPPEVVLGGKYRLLRKLGEGGMGVVHEAVNTWTGRRVAVKVLPEGDGSAERVRRFLQEARSAAALRHANIVDVLDLGREERDGTLFLVQELLEGETLRARLDRRGRLPPSAVAQLLRPVQEALAVAHARGIVHRDIKPENIIVARQPDGGEVPKLIDVGISKVLAEDVRVDLTRTGQVLGTPSYMAPEQLRGEPDVGPPADVWAMGVVLYECLSGELPFEAPNYNVLVYNVLARRGRALQDAAADVPWEVAALVHRALEPDPAARPTMEALAASLRPWADTTPTRPFAVAARSTAPRSALQDLRTVPRPTPRRAAWGLLGLAVPAALGLWALGRAHADTPRGSAPAAPSLPPREPEPRARSEPSPVTQFDPPTRPPNAPPRPPAAPTAPSVARRAPRAPRPATPRTAPQAAPEPRGAADTPPAPAPSPRPSLPPGGAYPGSEGR
jgi:serine/threonine-protein kinase